MSKDRPYLYANVTREEEAAFKAWCAQFDETSQSVLKRWILEAMRIKPHPVSKDYVEGWPPALSWATRNGGRQ